MSYAHIYALTHSNHVWTVNVQQNQISMNVLPMGLTMTLSKWWILAATLDNFNANVGQDVDNLDYIFILRKKKL